MWEKRRRDAPKKSAAGMLAQLFGMPVTVAEGLPEIELLGNREAIIEHYASVLEYNESVIRLNTGKLILKFTGRDLRLKCMTTDSVTVEGFFTSVEFL